MDKVKEAIEGVGPTRKKFIEMKQIKWKTFPRDFVVIQIGFLLFGLSIAFLIQANLGTSAWLILEVALAQIFAVTPGTMIVVVGFLILLGAILMREPIGWGTITNIIFIGIWVDLWLIIVPALSGTFYLQLAMLLLSVLLMGFATAIYISVDGGAGPRDSLMLAVNRVTGMSIRVSRGSIELLVVLIGTLLKGPIGIGTIIFALGIGPAVQWSFKLFGVKKESVH